MLITALHYAADGGHLKVASQLIIAGSHVCAVDCRGFTAAHLAARRGHAAVLERLLGAGYLVNTVNETHCTCLCVCVCCIRGCHMRVYSRSLHSRRTGCTALHLAAAHGHSEAVQVLLAAGANRDAHDGCGRTALHLAATAGGDVVDMLWQACDTLTLPTSDGYNMLHFACHGGDIRVVQRLLGTQDVDVNQAAANGRTPLFYSARGALLFILVLVSV